MAPDTVTRAPSSVEERSWYDRHNTLGNLQHAEKLAESQLNQLHGTTTTTTVLRPFRDHPGEPVPEENFCTLWCKDRLTEANTTAHCSITDPNVTSPRVTVAVHESHITGSLQTIVYVIQSDTKNALITAQHFGSYLLSFTLLKDKVA